jgi:uncharacterized repeat protein (TIGR01451 family)
MVALCTLMAGAMLTGAQAATVTFSVVSARNEPLAFGGLGVAKGSPISEYKYLVNIDNSGTTAQRSPLPGTGCSPQDAGYPDSCLWTSIAGAKGSSPIYTQGSVLAAGAPASSDPAVSSGPLSLDLPNGRYLVSVLADGYKLDGRHFTVSDGGVSWEGKLAADPATEVKVEMQPWPLPDSQIQAAVFEDVSPVNSAPDLPAEHGLAGFQGHITDYLGEVTTDVYGSPLCDTGRCLSACYVVDNGHDVGVVQPLDAAGRCPSELPPQMTTCGNAAPYLVGVSASMPFNSFQCPSGLGAVSLASTATPAGAVIEGKVKIPNLGPNRYALSVTPPDGSGWIQTTTLEGNHDWDAWVMEGSTGLDTEFMVAGEPFPAIIFGYVPVAGTPSAVGSALPTALTGTGSITGVVDFVKIYVPTTGGLAGLPGEIWGGLQGARIDKPIEYPWVTLTSLGNGDNIVWAGQGGADGKFTIAGVPAGTYTVTWWDEPQNTILDLMNVTVAEGETVDMGVLPLSGWWTLYDGYVFNDTNRNGVKDAGEPGLAGYTLTMRKRENSLMDRGTTVATTDANGYYKFEAAYPMTQWLVMEAYDDLHYTTGVTYQADNQPDPTTIIGAGVDVSVHPIIGLAGRMDWGKHVYDATGRNGLDPRNGGIVGTVSYDTTRNELDPRYAAVEDWQPSIPNLTVKLFAPVRCGATGAPCDPTGLYEVATDGALAKGPLLNTYVTENWQRPTGCVARGVDGTPLIHGVDEQVLPLNPDGGCIEAPLMGVQFAAYESGQGTPEANFGATVDGNYGFAAACLNATLDATDPAAPTCKDATGADVEFTPLAAGNYLVQVEIPTDARGLPIYKVTREEDINIGNGDEFVPAIPPSACAGALHTVDSTGNANFPGGAGTSPYEGLAKPQCDVKLVALSNGKSIAPAFNLYTDVPIPGRHWFIIIDDLNFSSNPKSVTYGEKAGMPFVPVGIYDYTDRLIKTVESDYNGLADVLLPSTNRINCPTPSGVCANLYRYVGNDPGVPGRLNANYNPSFRTIAAEFEILPGLLVPADLAPTQVGVTVQLPGGQTTSPVMCMLDDATPQLYAVSQPYVVRPATGGTAAVTIRGKGFGPSGRVTLDNVALATSSWSDTQIVATVTSTTAYGPHQLDITAANGQSTINGLTFHVIAGGATTANYNPRVFEVGPGRTYAPAETLPAAANHAIQRALDDATTFVAASTANATRGALVVVYPNDPTLANPRQNPRGAYYENLIVTSKVKLQGTGPGSPDGAVRGAIIDGGAFAGDSPVATDWYTRIGQEMDANGVPTWGGNATIYDGAVISIYVPAPNANANSAASRRAFPSGAATAAAAPSIDGFDLRGGDQQGFPGNINAIGGGATGLPPGMITQGGAIFANAFARNLQITNNVVQNNGGAYGTIRVGTPDLPQPDSQNDNVRIAHNRVIANAGTNLAGGIGLFDGADNYQVDHNDICGNFSAEYGGGITVMGMQRNPPANATTYTVSNTIHDNRIYNNRSYDEGGGVMIAGALPATTTDLSPGSGPIDVYNNLIQANLSNDDGGGLRFLMAGNFPMNVYNNVIVNNVSTHEGGGVAINDAPNVRVFNNTIMKNQTTATAITSNGLPAPAGLSTSTNSDLLQATLPAGSPLFSNPTLFNNIFWDNRAGTRAATMVTGLGAPGDATPIVNWDLGDADDPGALLAPTNSVLQTTTGTAASPTNKVGIDPAVAATYDVAVTFNAWRNNPAFLGAIMISADLPPNLMGNYHISAASPAYDGGAASKVLPAYQGGGNRAAPTFDLEYDVRPAFGGVDIGADEVRATTANLSITKTDGVTNAAPGQSLTYTITVSNAGPDAINGALVNDILPPSLNGASWVCAPVPSCGAASGSGNIATTVSLLNGASATFTVTATVNAGATGTLSNTATVAVPAGAVDPSTANNSATDTDTLLLPVDLSIAVTDNQTLVNRGGNVRYAIVVTNNGPNAVTGASVVDAFPGALAGSIGWSCTTTAGATCGGAATGTGNINRLVNMPAGSTVRFTTTSGSVAAGTTATVLSNTATVTAPANRIDTNPANNSATDTTTIQGFHLAAMTSTGALTNATQWSAAVTATVHDANHVPAAGVTVGGVWLFGGSGGGSCTTNASGQCTLTRTGIPRALPQITFAPMSLASAPNGYQPALNEAAPGIVVNRP